jgi:hypothetical protein
VVAGAVWSSLPLGMHLQGQGLPKQRTLILIHRSAWKGNLPRSICRTVHRAQVLRLIQPLRILGAQNSVHYVLRVRIKMRLGGCASSRQDTDTDTGGGVVRRFDPGSVTRGKACLTSVCLQGNMKAPIYGQVRQGLRDHVLRLEKPLRRL